MAKFVEPEINKQSFNCPHCGALAHQKWYNCYARYESLNKANYLDKKYIDELISSKESKLSEQHIHHFRRRQKGNIFLSGDGASYTHKDITNLFISECHSCKEIALWRYDVLLFPFSLEADEPNADMPLDVIEVYDEARAVLPQSSRAAAALLRLAIELLCNNLVSGSDNLYKKIGKLVEKGLDSKIQKALDAVRVIGNEAVHPGTIDLRDNKKTATILFKLVNQIVEQLITNDREINEIFDMLPENAKESIRKRDAGK